MPVKGDYGFDGIGTFLIGIGLAVGVGIGFVLFVAVPWVWQYVKPWLHQITG